MNKNFSNWENFRDEVTWMSKSSKGREIGRIIPGRRDCSERRDTKMYWKGYDSDWDQAITAQHAWDLKFMRGYSGGEKFALE